MNLNLDGSPITAEQHFQIAEASGVDVVALRNALVGVHSGAMILSQLGFATRAARFQMWGEGKLTLSSPRPTTTTPAAKHVDRDVFDFLTATIKESA